MDFCEGMEKIKGAYIFYTFNTLTQEHISMALESIADQEFEWNVFDFIIYNNSTQFSNMDILSCATEICGNKFRAIMTYPFPYPNTASTLDDLNIQFKHLSGYDFYLCHKADFSISQGVIQKVIDFHLEGKSPRYIGFAKFDLRENVSLEKTKELLKISFDEIMETGKGIDLTEVCPENFGIQYEYIGYRGLDGTMHSYNEAARTMLDLDSYCNHWTVQHHIDKGIDWRWGNKEVLALHIFHALPNGRNYIKDVEGYRF